MVWRKELFQLLQKKSIRKKKEKKTEVKGILIVFQGDQWMLSSSSLFIRGSGANKSDSSIYTTFKQQTLMETM